MRLSLWQQFSSNHSGFFWVVGTFKTVEAAQHAYNELRAMLQRIDRWHQEHPDAMTQITNNDPLPPEIEIAKQYNVPWPETIDWTNWANYNLVSYPSFANIDPQKSAAALIDKAIWIAGRTIEVSSPDQTWMTVQPFLGLLQRFGADAFGYDLKSVESGAYEGTNHKLKFSFAAPGETKASILEKAIRDYLEKLPVISDVNPPPWKEDAENFQRALSGKTILNRQAVESAVNHWKSEYDSYSYLPNPERIPAYVEMLPKRLALHRCEAFRRDGLTFEFENISFANEPLGLYALIAYLEVNGCTDIDIRYEQEANP
jgi:hypothetical protein